MSLFQNDMLRLGEGSVLSFCRVLNEDFWHRFQDVTSMRNIKMIFLESAYIPEISFSTAPNIADGDDVITKSTNLKILQRAVAVGQF